MKIALVRLREAGQLMTYKATENLKVNDYVIVEADRGIDYGEVIEISEVEENVSSEINGTTLKTILRKAMPEDLKQIKLNQKEAKEALKLCINKVNDYKLPMKLVDAEYSFDKKKIIFYFTSDERIDFREVVKDLAKIFKIRIEMRQIGVRDEARLFGGIGPCGEVLCCVRFLKNFEPVSIKMAKLQKLPLSAGKISGLCGRLMCCLFYEYKTYKELSKGLPKEGDTIQTSSGKAKVISVNILKRLVYVEFDDGKIEKLIFPLDSKKEENE